MKYDKEYLTDLYNSHSLEEFLEIVNIDNVSDMRTKAIIGALKRSINVLHLEFNPLRIKETSNKLKSQG